MLVERRNTTDVGFVVNGAQTGYLTVGNLYVYGGEEPVGKYIVDDRIVKGLIEIMRYYSLIDIGINSVYRTEAYNKRLAEKGYNASPTSAHMKGQAVDFYFMYSKYGKEGSFAQRPNVLQFKYKDDITKNTLLKQRLAALGINEFIFGKNYNHIAIDSNSSVIDNSEVKTELDVVVENNNKIKEPATSEYYEYLHLDSSITTVDELMSTVNTIISKQMITMQKFLEYKNRDNYTNLDRLWERYTVSQKISFSTEYSLLNTQYKNATTASDREDIKKGMAAVKLQYNSELPINVGTLLYIPKNKANIEVLAAEGKGLFMQQQDLSAFMWDEFKTLMNDPSYVPIKFIPIEGSKYTINYLNLSFNCWIYVRSLDRIINVTPFIRFMSTNVTDYGGDFSITLNEISDINIDKYSETWYSYIQKIKDEEFNLSFFNKYLQQNDIVFIRFERLDVEDDKEQNTMGIDVKPSELPGKVYDMIGLIDTSTEVYSSDANLSVIDINGRDLMKMLVEDSSVFFYLAMTNNTKEFFLNYNEQDTVFKRLWGSGQYFSAFIYQYRSIRDSVGFVFNRLTHTGILPVESTLFDAYKNSYNRYTDKYEDRTSKTYEINGANKEYLDSVDQNGIWKIIKAVVDNQLDERRLQNGELSNPEGTIYDLMKRICMDPFVEFWGDTMGDQYVFLIRQAPFTKQQITDYFTNNVVITITADSVFDTNLNWDDTYYTYFQIQPLESVIGGYQYTALAMMPIVYFEEFAQVFGMHKKVVSDNYIPQSFLAGVNSKSDRDVFREAVANDLQYLIESNIILPFTRKGKISIVGDRRIKRGMWIYFAPTNEIYYVRAVNNSVSVSGEINRKSVLTVERGMVKDYVVGESTKKINGKNVNYFDVVNINVIKDLLQVKTADGKMQISSSTSSNAKIVNKDIFDFFVQRKQFD